MKWKKDVIRIAVYILILSGISCVWKYIDIGTYGYSQRSAADALAAVFMTNWLDNRIWGRN